MNVFLSFDTLQKVVFLSLDTLQKVVPKKTHLNFIFIVVLVKRSRGSGCAYKNIFKFLLNQPESDCIQHFLIDMEPNRIPFVSKSNWFYLNVNKPSVHFLLQITLVMSYIEDISYTVTKVQIRNGNYWQQMTCSEPLLTTNGLND